jgi:hypothetical protein
MEKGPIFIGGPDRCGKTTLRAFLASHPNIAIPDVGSNMWTYFFGQYGDLGKAQNFEHCLAAMVHYKHVAFLKPDADRIRREFWQGPPTYARLFELFLLHYAERMEKPRWGVQTGLVERYADHIFAAYPGARMLHMVRDPRDRYEASLTLWPDGKGRAGGATTRWLYSVRLAQRNERLYSGQYRIVRFESLVLQPEQTLREVCAFLGEDYQPGMLKMTGAPKHRDRLTQGAGQESDQAPLSPAFIGRFRQGVPKHEIAFMQMFAGRQMIAFDYKLEELDFSAGDWLRFVLREYPLNLARMIAWQSRESIQHRFPAYFGRRPRSQMVLDGSGAR